VGLKPPLPKLTIILAEEDGEFGSPVDREPPIVEGLDGMMSWEGGSMVGW